MMDFVFRKTNAAAVLAASSFLFAPASGLADQYWHGDAQGIEWYPNGKNLT